MQKYNRFIRIFSLILLLQGAVARAQVVQWSTPVKLKGTAIFTKVLGENEHGIYTLRYRNRFYSKNVILQKYDHHLRMMDARSVDLRNARLVKIKITAKGIFLCTAEFNRRTQSNNLFVQYYDFNLRPLEKPRLIASTPVQEYGDRGTFRLRFNAERDRFSLIYTLRDKDKNAVVYHQLRATNWDLIDSSSHFTRIPFDNFLIMDFALTSNQKVNLLFRTIQKDRRRTVTTMAGIYTVANKEMSIHALPDSIQLRSMSLVYNKALDAVHVVGLYGLKDEYGVKGLVRFAEQGGAWQSACYRFTDDFIREVSISAEHRGVLSEGFDVLRVVPRSDGGFVVVAEQKEIAIEDEIVMVNGIPQSTSKNIYNFNEVLVMNFNEELSLDWYKLIAKNQTTVNDGGYFSSASIFVGEHFIQLIYNSEIRSSGDVVQYTIYNNGKIETSSLLKTEFDQVAIIPIESKQVSSNKLIIPTSKNRRFALLKLIYP